jgi:ribosomal subunit interface protein
MEIAMQLNVSGHHVEVTDSLREYVESKIEKTARHFDLVSDVQCILTVEKLRHKAEATVLVNGGTIYADHTEEDMYAAIDGLVDKLERRVRKYKEKLVDHHARDKQKIKVALMLIEEIIKPDAVLCNATARSKKHCLEILSELLVRSHPEITSDVIFRCLNDRERLGCTGLDRGAAFPHCRVADIDMSNAALIKLSEPVDFDAADGEPVDLVFGMLALRARLRSMNSSNDLYDALLNGAALVAPDQLHVA